MTTENETEREATDRQAYWARMEIVDVHNLSEAYDAERNHADRIPTYITNASEDEAEADYYRSKAARYDAKAENKKVKREHSETQRKIASAIVDRLLEETDDDALRARIVAHRTRINSQIDEAITEANA